MNWAQQGDAAALSGTIAAASGGASAGTCLNGLLSVDVSDYLGQAIDPRFAAKDARDLSAAVPAAGEGLFRGARGNAGSVDIALLNTDHATPTAERGTVRRALRPLIDAAGTTT